MEQREWLGPLTLHQLRARLSDLESAGHSAPIVFYQDPSEDEVPLGFVGVTEAQLYLLSLPGSEHPSQEPPASQGTFQGHVSLSPHEVASALSSVGELEETRVSVDMWFSATFPFQVVLVWSGSAPSPRRQSS